MIPTPSSVASDPIATHFRQLFASIDWHVLPERPDGRPGPRPIADAVYLKALLVKIDRQLPSIPALPQYLLEHPALQWEVGFRPRGVHSAVPSSRWLGTQQRRLGDQVRCLLQASAQQLATVVPDLDSRTALDATHHLAWVQQNNLNQSVPQRIFIRL